MGVGFSSPIELLTELPCFSLFGAGGWSLLQALSSRAVLSTQLIANIVLMFGMVNSIYNEFDVF